MPSERFLAALAGITDPQEKRKIIGHVFIDVFKHEADTISGRQVSRPRDALPRRHRSGGCRRRPGGHHQDPPQRRRPARRNSASTRSSRSKILFKDEVRRLGLELGLPEDIVWRHPFPGPGLAVRCLGEVTEERLDVLRHADAIVLEELKESGLVSQDRPSVRRALPVHSVGVMGDCRTYEKCVAVRAVQTDDFMTADWAHLPYELLAKISTRIINQVNGVNRVVYDISSKPPATIEWE